jgi:predicted Na+-dependent transporter
MGRSGRHWRLDQRVGHRQGLLALVFLPLVVGLFVRSRYAEHPTVWREALDKAANPALVVALATGIAANGSRIKSMFWTWVIVTAIIIVILAGALGLLRGLLLGGKSAESAPRPVWSRSSASDP